MVIDKYLLLYFAIFVKITNNHKIESPLMIDENTFFRSVTLSICGSLEIEKGMRACIRSMRDWIPVDQMFLETYEPDIGAMRTVAIATPGECSRVDLLTPFSERTRALIDLHVPAPDDVVVIDSEERSPVAREMLAFHGIPGWSVMWMRLATESGVLGAAVVTAQGSDRYIEHHANLFRLLEDPFTIALANALVHREVMRLRDRLSDDNRYLNRELMKVTGDEIVGADFGFAVSCARSARWLPP